MQRFLSVGELMKAGEAFLQTGPFGTQLKASEYVGDGVPVINVRNVGFGDVRDDDLEFVTEAKAEQLHHHCLLPNDIVFGRKGAVERHGLITEAQRGWVQGSDCLRLRLKSESVDVRYLSYYLRTKAHGDWMHALCSFGATMASLNQGIVARITFPAPAIEEQRKIAAILSAYDDLIANNQRRIALLEGMAEEIYREWFVRMRFPGWRHTTFKQGIPESWKTEPIEALFKTVSGGTPLRTASDNFGGEVAWVKTGELKTMFVRSTEESISAKGLESSAAKILPKHTVVMAMYCAMPDVAILGIEAATNQACCALVPKRSAIRYEWTYFFARAALGQLVNFAHGAAQQNLSQEIIRRFRVLYPGDDLVAKYSEQARPLFEQVDLLSKTTAVIVATRDALLPRLISGKLKVDHLDIRLPPSMQTTTTA